MLYKTFMVCILLYINTALLTLLYCIKVTVVQNSVISVTLNAYRDPVDRPNQVNKISALKANVTTLNFLRM